jgi:acetolactate synthase-1/2/3 large subunit
MELNGGEIVVKTLINQGVEHVFGYPGGAVLPLYDELFKQNHLKHILVRHEQAAVHSAEGYARSTGKTGVVLVTSGPGATNTVTGLTDALMDSIPLVCITGQVPSHLIGSDAFQEADTTGITRACTKHNYLVTDPADLAAVLNEAFYIASSGRPGPVVIDIPKDVFIRKALFNPDEKPTRRKSYNPIMVGKKDAVSEAVKLMASAKRPIFYTGGGIINSGDKASKSLAELVKITGFPITSTLMGLGCFPTTDPHFLGMLGMHGSLEANMAMHDCDVMINIGARFDDRVTGRISGFSPNSKKIHVDIDPSSINKNIRVDIPIIGDCGVVIEQMIDEWKAQKSSVNTKELSKWWVKINEWRQRKSFTYKPGKKITKPQYALERLNELTTKHDTYITTDVGQHQMWAAQFIQYNKPKRWMTSGGLGTMGYGLPAAIGVQVAHPESLVVCVSGEASFLMNIQELSTAVQYRLPVKIFILNNKYMGMVRQWQELFHGGRYSESYSDALPDFVKLAEAYGMKGLRCEDPALVDATIKEMISHKGPVLVDMCVDQNENVYPMIPAGAAHNELVMGPDEDSHEVSDEGRLLV